MAQWVRACNTLPQSSSSVPSNHTSSSQAPETPAAKNLMLLASEKTCSVLHILQHTNTHTLLKIKSYKASSNICIFVIHISKCVRGQRRICRRQFSPYTVQDLVTKLIVRLEGKAFPSLSHIADPIVSILNAISELCLWLACLVQVTCKHCSSTAHQRWKQTSVGGEKSC